MKKIIIILMMITLVVGCGKKEEKPEETDNIPQEVEKNNIGEITESGVIMPRNYDGIEIKNISYKYDGVRTVIKFDLINKKDKTIQLNNYKINIYSKENREIGHFDGYSNEKIKTKESLPMRLAIEQDYSKANKIDFNFYGLEELD